MLHAAPLFSTPYLLRQNHDYAAGRYARMRQDFEAQKDARRYVRAY